GGTDQGELKYRLAHRAALFLESDPIKQKEIFKFMKNAYDIRSIFVHGSVSKVSFPKKDDGKNMNLNEFEERTREIMRRAIFKVYDLAYQSKDTKFRIDWDNFIFPNAD
ncbi:hypothetical protein IQA68_18770, partial [Leptospira interrogans serovar Pomona]